MDYEVIIIGAGSMGMAAGYYLAKQGKRVLLVDKYSPPHTFGSHHGETRIIRHAYGEGESYVEMALRSQQLWKELEDISGEDIFLPTGVINVGESDSPFIQNVLKSSKSYKLNVEKLTADEINQRWSGFNVPDEYIGCYELDSGVLMSENCIRAFKKLALEHGAEIVSDANITAISIENNSVTVKANQQNYTAKSLILTAGAGTRKLLPQIGLELPLQELRTTFSWFETGENLDQYHSTNFPAFSFLSPIGTYYGFPSIHGAGVKIGRHDSGTPRDMDKPIDPFGTSDADRADVSNFAKQYMPDLGEHKVGKACTYTNTPDEDFIIDKHPEHDHVVIACGFSGHGFKFSSAVGEILSQLVTGNRESMLNIRQFSIKRLKNC
ncbi:N-methyl-L-tryptophan oxidase [Gracilibacillus xinjiangensis]|uniref:N-methyl-L-tryptophan oxidase n=1 Tax=Gracilibacillus xinjiangensis TaxID=1193282 RepID=A0ABV8WQX5_9BACI